MKSGVAIGGCPQGHDFAPVYRAHHRGEAADRDAFIVASGQTCKEAEVSGQHPITHRVGADRVDAVVVDAKLIGIDPATKAQIALIQVRDHVRMGVLSGQMHHQSVACGERRGRAERPSDHPPFARLKFGTFSI